MKIALYFENQSISGFDLSGYEDHNPGIGGTEYNFLTLVKNLKEYYPENEYCFFANDPDSVPAEFHALQASSCIKAIDLATKHQYNFFIWRPTVRDDSHHLVEDLESYNIKVIIWAHNTPTVEFLSKFSKAKNVVRFVPVGYEQHRLLRGNAICSKSTVIPNGFNPEKYFPDENIDSDLNLVVYLGSLIPVKGFGMLAKAWGKIILKHPNAKLRVIGGGNLYNKTAVLGEWGVADEEFEKNEIRPYLSDEDGNLLDSVEFLGVLGKEKIPILQKALIGVVNPTGRGENCPGSAVEFLAASTAVVSAKSEGILDVVDHEVTGLLGSTSEELVENISKLLGDPKLALRLGKAGPMIVSSRFNYESIVKKWQSIFVEETALESIDPNYFPYISKTELENDKVLRKWLERLPFFVGIRLYQLRNIFKKGRLQLSYKSCEATIEVRSSKGSMYFPKPMPQVKWLHASLNYSRWLYRKYSIPGYCEVDEGSVVFDCGAFVGGFSLAALERNAKMVHVFEPSPSNLECIKNNLAAYENVKINSEGLYKETKALPFNISDNPVENSLLTPDDDNISEVVVINVKRIDDYCRENDILTIDFLKVEAEGVELEIVNGIGDVRVKQIAVDCSPERDGKSPFEDIKNILKNKGYAVVKRGWNLYARQV